MTATAFNRVARSLHAATRNLIDGADVVVGIFTLFTSFGASMRRLEGKVQPNEADALVRAASTLTPEHRRVLAAAISFERSTRTFESVSWDGRDASEATRIIDAFIAANTPNAEETTLGHLIGAADALVNAEGRAATNASSASPSTDTSEIDGARARFETALADLPASLQSAARRWVADRVQAENPSH